jgi:hypothetical protein
MSKKATKAINNTYYVARYNAAKNNENLSSREKAAETMNIDRSRLARIELGNAIPYPEEVLEMSKTYGVPEMCNNYCAGECPIGKVTVKPINTDSLDRLTLQFLGSSKKMGEISEKLIEITEDGEVDDNEIADFDTLLSELEKVSVNIQSLILWAKKNKEAHRIKNS